MIEQFVIEQLEQELRVLYAKLEKVSDPDEKQKVQREIQERNLKLVRMMPNE